jgi:hypothetical protein
MNQGKVIIYKYNYKPILVIRYPKVILMQTTQTYEAPIRDTIRIRYDTDTPIRENF